MSRRASTEFLERIKELDATYRDKRNKIISEYFHYLEDLPEDVRKELRDDLSKPTFWRKIFNRRKDDF